MKLQMARNNLLDFFKKHTSLLGYLKRGRRPSPTTQVSVSAEIFYSIFNNG